MFLSTLPKIAAAARSWPLESQQVARRNAMIAATDCAKRRAEREDVADFLADRDAPPALPAPRTSRTAQG